MKVRKLYMALCGTLFAAQMVSAQQNMVLVDNNGEANAISVSSVNYATFNTNNKLFTITNDGIEGTRTNLITATCTVALSEESNVKTLSITPEVGVCYTTINKIPTIDDNFLTLGSELKSYTFSLSGLFSGATYYFCVYVKLADGVFYGDVTKAKTLGTAPVDNSKIFNGHQFVDLGLPSGLLWAETNIGADKPADDGNYYAWGETDPQSYYDWSTYKFGTSYNNMTKYNSSDGKTTLDPEDDAAYVNWGAPCRMPTSAEAEEICDTCNCTWTWTSKTASDGSTMNGYIIASIKNGNSIFLPFSGYIDRGLTFCDGESGHCWTSTLNSRRLWEPYYLAYGNVFGCYSGLYRCNGLSVRPVAEP